MLSHVLILFLMFCWLGFEQIDFEEYFQLLNGRNAQQKFQTLILSNNRINCEIILQRFDPIS